MFLNKANTVEQMRALDTNNVKGEEFLLAFIPIAVASMYKVQLDSVKSGIAERKFGSRSLEF